VCNQAIEKNRQLSIAAILKGRVIFFFQPVAYQPSRHHKTGCAKDSNHFGIIKVEAVADTPQYIIIFHKGTTLPELLVSFLFAPPHLGIDSDASAKATPSTEL
jgi:hypothetical protein